MNFHAIIRKFVFLLVLVFVGQAFLVNAEGSNPSYLLPTDPNAAPYGQFVPPGTSNQPVGSQSKSIVSSPISTVSPLPATWCPGCFLPSSDFTINLSIGSRGAVVSELQRFLKSFGFFSGDVTDYFGPLTRQALIRYQQQNGISPASGYFGPLTRAKIKALIQGNANSNGSVSQNGIVVTSPVANDIVVSPLRVTGVAAGSQWSCVDNQVGVASLLDASGAQLASGPLMTTKDCGSTGAFPFETLLSFEKPATQTGSLVLRSQNRATTDVSAPAQVTIPVRFQTTQSSISFSAPVGGERWNQGQQYQVRWSGGERMITLSLLGVPRDAASVANSGFQVWSSGQIENTGSYAFTVPSELVGQFRFKITDTTGNSALSNYFAITPATSGSQSDVVVTSPSAGDQWKIGGTYTIAWQSPLMTAIPHTATISLIPPRPACLDATPACKIAVPVPYVIASNINNSGSYTWKIPTDLPAAFVGTTKISVSIDNNSVLTGTSAPFLIVRDQTPPPSAGSLTVTAPNGGEVLVRGQNTTISWTGGTYPIQVGVVRDDVSSSGYNAVGWITQTGSPNGSVAWNAKTLTDLSGASLPDIQPGRYRIVVVAANAAGNRCFGSSTCVFDFSDSTFTIVDDSKIVPVTLNQQFSLKVGQTARVVDFNDMRMTFNSLAIPRCTNGCVKSASVTVSTLADGTKSVTISNGATEVVFGAAITLNRVDDSNEFAVFTIQKQQTTQSIISVVAPNGGEQYSVGQAVNLSWRVANQPVGSWVALFLRSTSLLSQPLLIAQRLDPLSGSYTWRVPSITQSGTDYKIEARLYTGPNLCVNTNACPDVLPPALVSSDVSDAPFSISGTTTPPSSLTIDVGQIFKLPTDSTALIRSGGVIVAKLGYVDACAYPRTCIRAQKLVSFEVLGTSVNQQFEMQPGTQKLVSGFLINFISVDGSTGVFQVTQGPSVSYITPTTATIGQSVALYGTNITQNTYVVFDGPSSGQTAVPTAYTNTSLTFVVPSLSFRVHTIQLAEKGSSFDLSNSVSLTVIPTPQPPTISSVSPVSAQVGQTVTVLGANFNQNTYVVFDGSSGQSVIPTAYTNTSLTFVVPATLSVGSHTLQLGEKGSSFDLSASVSFAVLPVVTPPPTISGNQKIIVPAYFYPSVNSSYWNQLTAANGVGIAIFNPNSGPGASANSDYVRAVSAARSAGVKMIGYVATTYGTKPISVVKAEIDRYYSWYTPDGIFLDEAEYRPSETADLAYYRQLYSYIKSKNATSIVVTNPGATPDAQFAASDITDLVLIFENTYSTFSSWSAPSWAKSSTASSRFGVLVYGASRSQVNSVIQSSQNNNVGYVYVTDDGLPNPWDTLPSYFSCELSGCLANASGASSDQYLASLLAQAVQLLAALQAKAGL